MCTEFGSEVEPALGRLPTADAGDVGFQGRGEDRCGSHADRRSLVAASQVDEILNVEYPPVQMPADQRSPGTRVLFRELGFLSSISLSFLTIPLPGPRLLSCRA
jgi:hypothetical protein